MICKRLFVIILAKYIDILCIFNYSRKFDIDNKALYRIFLTINTVVSLLRAFGPTMNI